MNTDSALRHTAPWGRLLRNTTLAASLACLGLTVVLILTTPGVVLWTASLPALIVGASALFTVREYTVTPDALIIRRPIRSIRIARADIREALDRPDAMRGSLRLWGNGGLFSFSGIYRNAELGNYRAYATDLSRTVVLRTADGRTYVLSPADPAAFVRDLTA